MNQNQCHGLDRPCISGYSSFRTRELAANACHNSSRSCVLDRALFNKKSIQDIGNNMQPHPVSLRCQFLIRHSPKYRTDVLFHFYPPPSTSLQAPTAVIQVTRCRACTSAGVALCLKPNFSRQNIRPCDHLKKVFFACPSAVLSRLKWT
jgi:hypothetical protein